MSMRVEYSVPRGKRASASDCTALTPRTTTPSFLPLTSLVALSSTGCTTGSIKLKSMYDAPVLPGQPR
jgi:hypothetical protein